MCGCTFGIVNHSSSRNHSKKANVTRASERNRTCHDEEGEDEDDGGVEDVEVIHVEGPVTSE